MQARTDDPRVSSEASAQKGHVRRHTTRGPRTEYDRELTAHARRADERDLSRADRTDHLCTCGWITAREVCPGCEGVRVGDEEQVQ